MPFRESSFFRRFGVSKMRLIYLFEWCHGGSWKAPDCMIENKDEVCKILNFGCCACIRYNTLPHSTNVTRIESGYPFRFATVSGIRESLLTCICNPFVRAPLSGVFLLNRAALPTRANPREFFLLSSRRVSQWSASMRR